MKNEPQANSLPRTGSPAARAARPHFGIWGLLVTATVALLASAQAAAPLAVSMMPSYNQNPTYANAAINESLQVWGRVSGGSGSYAAYTLDFGDGSPAATGFVNNGLTTFQVGGPDFIEVDHAYPTGGSKTVKLTVSDSNGDTASGTAVIRVLLTPTHDERVNMAIEKGLIYLYRTQTRTTIAGVPVSYWNSSGGQVANAAVGASLMCFGENGHQASNDPVGDVYAETMIRGINWTVTRGRNIAIGVQAAGDPDTNGNGRGIYFDDTHAYAHSFLTMGVINAFPDAAAAQAAIIPAGLWTGGGITPATFYELVEDSLDDLYWCQADTGYKGWHYQMNTASSGGGAFDGSTHQWPNIAILSAEERWGTVPPAWVVSNSMSAFVAGTDQNPASPYYGGTGYNSPVSWRNTAKTGGALVGYYLGEKLIGSDADADRSFEFIKKYWAAAGNPGADGGGWTTDFYAMFALKKGLQLQGVTTLTTPDGGAHDWYQEMSGWLLGNASLLDGSLLPPPSNVPVNLAAIDSITFEMLNTCFGNTANYSFSLNGASLGTVVGNPTGSCTCSPPLTSFTVNNAALLANWIPGANANALGFTIDGSIYIAWVRATIVSGATTTTVYLFDQPGGAFGDLNLCSAGYAQYDAGFTMPPSGALGEGKRNLANAFGQQADGSWVGPNSYPGGYGKPITTPHAILILTKAVTIPLPVAVIGPVADQSARFPAAFTLDGTASYHQDSGIPLVEWLWILDAGATPDWNNPDASGQAVSVNPGWDTESVHTATLRVKDNQDPANYSFATININVTLNDVAPVAVPIPASMIPPIYTAQIGQEISLDGTESYDPEGDPIISYAWDLNGDGVYGGAGDAALDTSGQNAGGSTATMLFGAEYTGQVGLKVCSQPDIEGAPAKCGISQTPIEVYVSPSDLTVLSVTAANVVLGVSADITAILANAVDSGSPYTGVIVRFYDGDPFTTGAQIGGNYLVDLPIGGTATVVASVALTVGQEFVFAKVDANNVTAEYNEANNTGFANVANQPPTVSLPALGPFACNDELTVSATVGDLDGDALTADWTVDGSPFETHNLAGGAREDSISSVFGFGEHTVEITVTDGKSDPVTATMTFTIDDTEEPVITGCPENILVYTGPGRATCDQEATWTPPLASDNCTVDFTTDWAPGSTFPVGTTTVTCTATDGFGNETLCTFTVTVVDNTAPVISGCPTDIIVNNDPGVCGALVVYLAPGGADNCPGDVTSQQIAGLASGETFPVGTTVNTFVVTDGSGNTATCSFSVTVLDTEAPVITTCLPAVSVLFAAEPDAAVTVTGFLEQGGVVSDNCGLVEAVTSVDSVAGLCPTIVTRTYTLTDTGGNTTTCDQIITVNNLFAGDGIVWHQPLARNGMSEDTDPGAGNTLKYRFKLGSTIPIQIHAQGCTGEVTENANVIGKVEVFGDTDMDGVSDGNSLLIDYNGVGEAGGLMDKIGPHLKYDLDTKKLPVQTSKCYVLQVTITDTSTGEASVETVPLQSK